MNSFDRSYGRRDPRLPLTAVKERFDQIATQQVPLSPQAAAALPESPVTWGRLRALLTDSSVPFTVMDVDAVWTWLISRARREGPDAVLACAGLAVPMMASAAARLARRVGGDRADAEAAVLTAFLEASRTSTWGRPGCGVRCAGQPIEVGAGGRSAKRYLRCQYRPTTSTSARTVVTRIRSICCTRRWPRA